MSAPIATAPGTVKPSSSLPQFTTGAKTPSPAQLSSGAPLPAYIAETSPPPTQAQMGTKVDCQGYWTPCDFTSLTQTYIVTTQPSNGGAQCPNKTGDTQPCSLPFVDTLKAWFSKNMTTENFMYLVYALVVLAVLRGVFGTLREFFGGGGGGGGRVTVVT